MLQVWVGLQLPSLVRRRHAAAHVGPADRLRPHHLALPTPTPSCCLTDLGGTCRPSKRRGGLPACTMPLLRQHAPAAALLHCCSGGIAAYVSHEERCLQYALLTSEILLTPVLQP